MVLKTRSKYLADYIEFKKGVLSPPMQLPQDNLVRRISLDFNINLVTAATAAVGIKNTKLTGLIKRIQIRYNGSIVPIDVDLTNYVKALTAEYGTAPYLPTLTIPAANTNKDFKFTIPIDFALIRNQISDFSALAPATELDSFELLIEWGDVSDLFTTVNNTTVDKDKTQANVAMIEVYDNENTAKNINTVLKNLVSVYEGIERLEITQKYDSYPASQLTLQLRPLPANHLLHVMSTLKNITDGNPSYADDVVTDVKLDNVKGGGEALFYNKWDLLQREQKLDFDFESDNMTGTALFDWRDYRVGALANIDVDALKYHFLTKAPTADKKNAIDIYKKFIPLG